MSAQSYRVGTRVSQLLTLMAVLLAPWSVHAFRIVEPTPDTAVTAGQTVTARIDPGNVPGVVEVRFFWYFELEEVQREEDVTSGGGMVGRAPALVATAESEPPFSGQLRVPKKAIGIMRLLAVGEISRGRLGSRMVFDEILIEANPNGNLVAIDFETDHPRRFGKAGREAVYAGIDSLGKTFELPVVGLYSDGVVRPISLPSSGTTYESSDESIVKVHPIGLLQLMGNGKASVIARNSGVEASLDVQIEVPPDANEPPEANPGPNQSVRSGSRVVLNGGNSLDPEGGRLRYHWAQIRGARVPLLDLNMPQASFQAPEVTATRLLRFSLRVTDELEADSLPAFVDIIVKP